MDVQLIREHSQAICEALLAGDVDRAFEDFSPELISHRGQLMAQLPLPLAEAVVESVEPGGKGYLAVVNLVGESGTTRLQIRWKERDGRPTVVETSHVVEKAPPSSSPEEASEESG